MLPKIMLRVFCLEDQDRGPLTSLKVGFEDLIIPIIRDALEKSEEAFVLRAQSYNSAMLREHQIITSNDLESFSAWQVEKDSRSLKTVKLDNQYQLSNFHIYVLDNSISNDTSVGTRCAKAIREAYPQATVVLLTQWNPPGKSHGYIRISKENAKRKLTQLIKDVVCALRSETEQFKRVMVYKTDSRVHIPEEAGIMVSDHPAKNADQIRCMNAYFEVLRVGTHDDINRLINLSTGHQTPVFVAVKNWGEGLEPDELEGKNIIEIPLEHDLGAFISHCNQLASQNPEMRTILQNLSRIAEGQANVLITGESGVGKEMLAKAIHSIGSRRDKPFVPINCGGLSKPLLESDLFGHMKGAFTDANADKEGLFETVKGGTVFLDEVGEMSEAIQIKLLRVLEEKQFRRVGGTRNIQFDGRIITATNKDLMSAIHKAAFREDLYYRMSVVPIHIPPLRCRKDSIPSLVRHFIRKNSSGKVVQIENDAMTALNQYDYPGNVRELDNIIQRALTYCKGTTIGVQTVQAAIKHYQDMPVREAQVSTSQFAGKNWIHLMKERLTTKTTYEELKLDFYRYTTHQGTNFGHVGAIEVLANEFGSGEKFRKKIDVQKVGSYRDQQAKELRRSLRNSLFPNGCSKDPSEYAVLFLYQNRTIWPIGSGKEHKIFNGKEPFHDFVLIFKKRPYHKLIPKGNQLNELIEVGEDECQVQEEAILKLSEKRAMAAKGTWKERNE